MSFREKSAWISLISILLVSGFFSLHVTWTLAPPLEPQLFWGLLWCFLALVVIEVVAHLVVVFRAPQDARAPKDERERLIDLKATRVAHWVYAAGSLLAVFVATHFGGNVMGLSYLVLLSFVIGQITKNAARIAYHRRGF